MGATVDLLIGFAVVVLLAVIFWPAKTTSPHWQIPGIPDREESLFEAHCIANQRRAGRERGGRILTTWKPGQIPEWDQYGKWLECYGAENGVFMTIIPARMELSR